MYILSCPSCQHETQVRFARNGARATCLECQAQYELNNETMILEPGTEPETKGRKARRKGPLEELVLTAGSTSTAPAKLTAVD
ncbi:MAG: hypothetical protein OER86_04475, partial [Phycisphaerae bacterium]|nr:hypothetical protein [Phycisphaerae bacterium]